MSRTRSMVGPARRRRGNSQARLAEGVAAAIAPVDPKPVRGVKLKHVSTITIVVAFVCLFAYLAGRVDVSAATSAPGYGTERCEGACNVLGIAHGEV